LTSCDDAEETDVDNDDDDDDDDDDGGCGGDGNNTSSMLTLTFSELRERNMISSAPLPNIAFDVGRRQDVSSSERTGDVIVTNSIPESEG